MKQIFTSVIIVLFFCAPAVAQTDSLKTLPTYRVGIFAPLYLDSVFSQNTFRYKQGIPKFIVPALEFVQGAQVALDSMKMGTANIEAYIFDTRSYTQNIANLIRLKKLDNLDLIVGAVRDADYKQLADLALLKKIPFISATHPNDGGITNNPYTIILNSTLKTHCEAIYSYLLQNHGTDIIYLCRQEGAQEDKVAGYFKQLNEQDGKALLNIQTLTADSGFTAAMLQPKLDSNRKNIIIGASLDVDFAKSITTACFDLQPAYPITLFGMPNWDGFTALRRDFKDFPIYYTTPYYNSKWDAFSKQLIAAYHKKYRGKPSDMAFKGFEAVQLFTQLLVKHKANTMTNLNDKSVKAICEYNFRPVLLKKDNTTPDYFENKHLYFIRLLNGTKSKAW
jgi:ABC-type branched-subunit amino acid transport system substrate-binding protein